MPTRDDYFDWCAGMIQGAENGRIETLAREIEAIGLDALVHYDRVNMGGGVWKRVSMMGIEFMRAYYRAGGKAAGLEVLGHKIGGAFFTQYIAEEAYKRYDRLAGEAMNKGEFRKLVKARYMNRGKMKRIEGGIWEMTYLVGAFEVTCVFDFGGKAGMSERIGVRKDGEVFVHDASCFSIYMVEGFRVRHVHKAHAEKVVERMISHRTALEEFLAG